MEDLKCPVCKTELDIVENGDFKCPNCYRHWYHTGIEEAPLASRKRKVKLTKEPEEGDDLNDVIEPVSRT